MIAIREAISPNWAESLAAGKVCFGLDVASTEGKKSNPSSLTATEYWDRIYWQRLVVRWKTEHYAVMLGILELVIGAVPREQRGVLVVDTSNEKFLARGLAKDLSGLVRVVGVYGQQVVRYCGEKSDAKTAMGAAYCSALEDALIAMPPGKWLETDHRLVTRNGARFEADVDAQGNHADTFDSGKLSYWGHIGTGLESCSPSSWRHRGRQGNTYISTGVPDHLSLQSMIDRQQQLYSNQAAMDDRDNQDQVQDNPALSLTYDSNARISPKAPTVSPRGEVIWSSATPEPNDYGFRVQLEYDEDGQKTGATITPGKIMLNGRVLGDAPASKDLPMMEGEVWLNLILNETEEITGMAVISSAGTVDPFMLTSIDGARPSRLFYYSFPLAVIKGDEVIQYALGTIQLPVGGGTYYPWGP